jgi:hypothetical protein
VDLSLARDFRVSPKYGVTITARAFNLTDYFNALGTTTPPTRSLGSFLARIPGEFRLDFDVNF